MIDSLKKIISTLIADQRIRFLLTGGINTAVGYGTFAFLIFIGVHYLVANVISTSVGVACSYILNKYFTFQKKEKSMSEVFRFVSVYAASFVLGNVLLFVLVDKMSLSPYWAGILNLIFTTLISWFGHKYYSFRT